MALPLTRYLLEAEEEGEEMRQAMGDLLQSFPVPFPAPLCIRTECKGQSTITVL